MRIASKSFGVKHVRGTVTVPRLSFDLLFEPRDLWVGVFVEKTLDGPQFYVSFLPMIPIRISFARSWWRR